MTMQTDHLLFDSVYEGIQLSLSRSLTFYTFTYRSEVNIATLHPVHFIVNEILDEMCKSTAYKRKTGTN